VNTNLPFTKKPIDERINLHPELINWCKVKNGITVKTFAFMIFFCTSVHLCCYSLALLVSLDAFLFSMMIDDLFFPLSAEKSYILQSPGKVPSEFQWRRLQYLQQQTKKFFLFPHPHKYFSLIFQIVLRVRIHSIYSTPLLPRTSMQKCELVVRKFSRPVNVCWKEIW